MQLIWAGIRDSLWFVPAVMTLTVTILGTLLLVAERARIFEAPHGYLIFSGGAEAARSLLAAVAGGLITVTGVAFSVTVVALQLSSTQFTPRVLPSFLSDRANQYVLGTLIGTFTYCLILLRVVDDPARGGPGELPRASIALAMLLSIASIAALIFFINHTARSIQVSVILVRAVRKALGQVDTLFPEQFGEEGTLPPGNETPPDDHLIIRSDRCGYIQSVDDKRMFSIPTRKQVFIRMEHRIGAFVLSGQPLAIVWPADAFGENATDQVKAAFVIGSERTFEQDYELSLIEVSDIAVKALSPGINDPTTAHLCIDRLAELLLAFAIRHSPGLVRVGGQDLHVLIKDLPFGVALDRALTPILHFGSSNPSILRRVLERIETLLELVPPACREPLITMRAAVMRRARAFSLAKRGRRPKAG